jgi:hypothetical protein
MIESDRYAGVGDAIEADVRLSTQTLRMKERAIEPRSPNRLIKPESISPAEETAVSLWAA